MEGFPITFNIYANNEAEVEEARQAIILFINHNAQQGRAVTAKKISEAVQKWGSNPFIQRQILNYLQK